MTNALDTDELTAAAVQQAIRDRRSISAFLQRPVPESLLEQALDAGRFAPNHKLTEPWRFTIVGPVTRQEMAPLWAEFAVRKLPPDAPNERKAEVLKAANDKWLSKPAVVVVSQVLAPEAERRREDYAAVACAMQNIQLAAWVLGLGCQWSTNPAIKDPTILDRLGIPPTEEVVGLLFVGYPAAIPSTHRRPLEEILRRTA